jgi:hypothetical protein
MTMIDWFHRLATGCRLDADAAVAPNDSHLC